MDAGADVALLPASRRRSAGTAILLRHYKALVGLALLVAFACIAVAAPWLAPRDPSSQDFTKLLRPPGAGGALGTDHLGRDVLSRLVYGARVSLLVGLGAVLMGGTIGTAVGVLGGYFGRWADNVAVSAIDVFLSFPTILLALAFIAILGSGTFNVILALGLSVWPGVARVVRGEVIRIREFQFVEAARALGVPDARIITRHVLPNILSALVVLLTFDVGTAILTEASLGFLGLGVPPPLPTWGRIVSEGQEYMRVAPWVITFGGLAISLTVLALNLLGDGLRDILDPRLRERD